MCVEVTEDVLIHGCLNKDPRYETELFNKYSKVLFRLARKYARNREDAQDILQDAFVNIFERLTQFKHKGSFEGWLKRIVINTALSKYRSLRCEKEINQSELVDQYKGFAPELINARLNEKELIKLIKTLPTGYQTVFNLYVLEGYAHDEIANILNILPGSSRSQLVKARILLQKKIQNNLLWQKQFSSTI